MVDISRQTWRTDTDVLAVERAVEYDDSGGPATLRVELTVTTTVEHPVAFRVAETVPAGVDAGEFAFEPADCWSVYDADLVAVSASVHPGSEFCATVRVPSVPPAQTAAFEHPPVVAGTAFVAPDHDSNESPIWRGAPAASAVESGTTPENTTEGTTFVRSASTVRGSSSGATGSDAGAGDDAGSTFAALKSEHDPCEYEEIADEVEQVFDDDVSFESLFLVGAERGRESTRVRESAGDRTDRGDDAASDDSGTKVCQAVVPSVENGTRHVADGGDASGEASFDFESGSGGECEAGEHGSTDDETDARTPVLSALAAELRERDPSAEELTALRDALQRRQSSSVEVRIRHLQSKVADLMAYVDALEAFVDGNGTAAQLLERLESDVAEVATRLDDVEDELEDVRGAQKSTRRRVDALAARQDEIDATVSQHRAAIEEIHTTRERRHAELDRRIAAVAERQRVLGGLFETAADELADDISPETPPRT